MLPKLSMSKAEPLVFFPKCCSPSSSVNGNSLLPVAQIPWSISLTLSHPISNLSGHTTGLLQNNLECASSSSLLTWMTPVAACPPNQSSIQQPCKSDHSTPVPRAANALKHTKHCRCPLPPSLPCSRPALPCALQPPASSSSWSSDHFRVCHKVKWAREPSSKAL